MEFGDDRMKKFPSHQSDLFEKRLVFDEFIARLQRNRLVEVKDGDHFDGLRTPNVQFWCQTEDAMIILYSNNSIQVFRYAVQSIEIFFM